MFENSVIENCKLKIAKHNGFTLIEMLVVVFVLGVGLIGALSFFNINLNNQFEAKKELIAAGLAQEGADLVRNIRDYNLLNGKAFDFNLASCTAIDFNSLSNHQCVSNQNICMDANLRYCQCGASCSTSTGFTRTIAITAPDASSKKVVCTVSWNGRTTQSVDYLYSNSF